MFLGIAILCLLLFFPIYLEANFHYKMQDQKVGFALYLCKHFRILGGYISDYPGGFALHTGKNKVILLPFDDTKGRKKRISIFRRFQISDFAITTETGAEYLPLTMLLHTTFRHYFLWQGGTASNFQSHIWLQNGDNFALTANGVARINLYMQICAWLHLIKEKIENGDGK